MKSILKKLCEKAEVEFLNPAKEKKILQAEERLGVQLPKDYRAFLYTTNGFPSTDFTDPTFLPVEEIDYLKNIEEYTIEAYSEEGIEEVGEQLSRSILVAGKDEEQYFLLIPPTEKETEWTYWKFANWIPGEEPYENLETYFEDVLAFLEEIENEENSD